MADWRTLRDERWRDYLHFRLCCWHESHHLSVPLSAKVVSDALQHYQTLKNADFTNERHLCLAASDHWSVVTIISPWSPARCWCFKHGGFMLKAATTSDSAEEQTLQTHICQTRCSFSRRRRGHLLSQPSRSRGEREPVRWRWYRRPARGRNEYVDFESCVPSLGADLSAWACVLYAPSARRQTVALKGPAEHRVIGWVSVFAGVVVGATAELYPGSHCASLAAAASARIPPLITSADHLRAIT